jgi:site-specific DNA recombinase
MTKNAVIYVRVSTDEQTKGYSIQSQEEACQHYATEHDYRVMGVFKDDYTGASLDRPGLNSLRAHMESDSTQAVIVYDIDRLARKSIYQALLEEEFKRLGAIIEYVIGQFDDSDEGRLQKQIRASIAEYEKAKIAERSKRGKRGKAKCGFVLVAARPPYGYKVKAESHKAWLEVDQEEAEIVRWVFNVYTGDDRPALNKVAAMLTNMNVPTRGDKHKHIAKKRPYAYWTPAMIRHILTNETYIGCWHFGKTRMIEDGKHRAAKSKRGLGKQVARDKSEWIPVNVPAIIDVVTFGAAKERLAANKVDASRNKNPEHEYLMSNRLACACCGYTYVGNTRRTGQAYYRCNGKIKYGAGYCHMPGFRVDTTDDLIWKWVAGVISEPATVIEGLRAVQSENRLANRALYDRLDIIDHQVTETSGQLTRLLDLYLSGDFPKEVLTERKARLEETLLKLKKERAENMEHLQSKTIPLERIDEIEDFCKSVRAGLEAVTFRDRRRIIELLDVRGKIAVEENEKVVYIRCLLGQRRLPVAVTLPLLCNHSETWALSARLVLAHPLTLAGVLFSNTTLERVE